MECVKPLFKTLKPAEKKLFAQNIKNLNLHHAKCVGKHNNATIPNIYLTFSVQDSLGPLALDL